MRLLAKSIEEPWAFQYRTGFVPKPDNPSYGTGLYFRYFRTKEEAERIRAKVLAKGKFAGPIEHRPGESFIVGSVF